MVRYRVLDGVKSAGSTAKQTLILIAAATDANVFVNDPLVKGQLCGGQSLGGAEEPAVQALDVGVDIVIKMEALAIEADTLHLRCYAGFFALIGNSSLRASDALRTRGLRLSEDSLSGVSRMKGKTCWTRWTIPRGGLSGRDWPAKWIQELNSCSLPGRDFLLFATTNAAEDWLHRPALYADARRMLHLILMIFFDMDCEEAARYNPHGFRHVMVTAGQQARALGALGEGDLERLGHWNKGSAMPLRYDSSAGVSELVVRSTITNAVRAGWRPAPEGNLPVPLPTNTIVEACPPSVCSRPLVSVGHRRSLKVHRTRAESGITLCRIWKCGTSGVPLANAEFENISVDWKKCRNCW